MREILEEFYILMSKFYHMETNKDKNEIFEIALSAIRQELLEKLPEEKNPKHDETGESCGCKYLEEDYPCENEKAGFNSCLSQVKKIVEEIR